MKFYFEIDDKNEDNRLIIKKLSSMSPDEGVKTMPFESNNSVSDNLLYASILDEIPFELSIFNELGQYLYLNKRAINNAEQRNWIIGHTEDEFYAKFHSKDQPKAEWNLAFKECMLKLKPTQWFETVKTSENTEKVYLRRYVPSFGKDKKLLHILRYGIEVTDLKQSESILLHDKAELEKSLSVKSQFMSAMSHEIRTPMNAIIGFTELLNEIEDNGEKKSYITTIKNSADHLLHIINEVLNFSSLESKKVTYANEAFSMSQVIALAESQISNQIKHKNLEYSNFIAEDFPDLLKGDAGKLSQVLINLLVNAVKFTDHGKIALYIGVSKQVNNKITANIQVADTGIGMAEDKQSHIFESFTQLDTSNSKKQGGVGLGLAIVKTIVDQMGGEISLESKPNKGTIFTLTLDFEIALESDFKNLESVTPPNLTDKHILLVEDNIVNQLVISQILRKTQAGLDIVDSGPEAISYLKKNPCDLVLLDLHLPGMSGFDAALQIKNFSQVHIIAVTADVFDKTALKAYESGIDQIITKPIKMMEMFHILRNFFQT